MKSANATLLLLWGAFIVSFVVIRISVRMIRAQVRWWPGNVTAGGHHIHHIVFGLVLVLVTGFASFTPLGRSDVWEEGLAVGFGIGAALVLDEFALVLHLRDVYWSEEGRSSVDAVVLGAAVSGLLVSGVAPFGLPASSGSSEARISTAVWIAINVAFVAAALLKGKFWTGFLGILVPGLACVGAIRVARPGSPWARRYAEDSKRLERARRRELRRSHVVQVRHRLLEVVTGQLNHDGPGQLPDKAAGDSPAGGPGSAGSAGELQPRDDRTVNP